MAVKVRERIVGPRATRPRHVGPPWTLRTAADLTAVVAITGLVYIGYFKAAFEIPIDLTVVFAALTLVTVVWCIVRWYRDPRISAGGAIFVLVCLPAMFAPVATPETVAMRVRLLIPLLVVIAVGVLLRSDRRQRMWVWAQAVVGLLVVATGSANEAVLDRFTGAGANTIGAGRAAGAALIVVLVLTIGSRGHWLARLVGIGVIGWLAAALVSTGSRGPVIACAVALLAVAAFAPGRYRLARLLGAVIAVAVGLAVVISSSSFAAERLLTFSGASADSRLVRWGIAWENTVTHPLGIGWGNFYDVLPDGIRRDLYYQYPHNMLLEVGVSAGWAALVVLVVLLALSLWRLRATATDGYGTALFALGVFFVINAMVSGDLNDNRMMWAALAIAWVRPATDGPYLPVRRRRGRAEDAAAPGVMVRTAHTV